MAAQVGVSVATVRRWYWDHLVDYRRDEDDRVLIDLRSVPKDLAARVHRRNQEAQAAHEAAQARGPLAELQRHLRWLEDRLAAQDAAMAAQATQAAEERTRAHEERQRLLGLLERTSQPPS